MESKVAKSLELKYAPVAVLWSDAKPDGAMQFEKGRWGCVMAAFGAVAEKGKTYVFDKDTYGCPGGGVGLGFGNCYTSFIGGVEGFCAFLSSGNEKTERGQKIIQVAQQYLRGSQLEHFKHGEGYRKDPAAVARFIECLPITDVPAKYVIFKPLSEVKPEEKPVAITFLADPDQLSAMLILANYENGDGERAIIPHAAGCQTMGIYAYREAKRQPQRAVVGHNDVSARKTLRRLGKDLLTFSVPLALYEEMERNIEGSFVERETWKSLRADN